MCVQFQNRRSLSELATEYGAEVPKFFEWKPEVFPKYPAPVLIWRRGRLELVPMQFGLIPHFERDPKPKKVFHNARSETLRVKPSFQRAFRETRCLVPMEAFFESIESRWVRFSRAGSAKPLLTAAALWSLWRNPESGVVSANFSILTREPPPFIEETGHDRCPFFLEPKVWRRWLAPEIQDYDALEALLREGREEPVWGAERL